MSSFDASFWNEVKNRLVAKNQENKPVRQWLNSLSYLSTETTPAASSDSSQTPEDLIPRLILGVSSEFERCYLVDSLLEKISDEVRELSQKPVELDIRVVENLGKRNPQPNLMPVSDNSEPHLSGQLIGPSNEQPLNSHFSPGLPPTDLTSSTWNQNIDFVHPNMTFSSFVVGKNSEFAHAACYNVARNPGDSYNPLLICGPTGLGKTHLLLGVGHEIRRSFPHLNVVYIQAEMFLESYVNAIMTKNNEAFRKKYRDNCDVFLVDDIQFINVGERTQVEFFHIINYLLERKKQIVLASDRMPKDILGLTDRNRSRLEWGLIVEISMPDFETRMAILRYKMEQLNMYMPDEVIEYIAKISKTSIRQLEGNLKKIKMFADLQGSKIDYAMAKRVLTTHENTNTLTIEEVQRIVADHYKVKITDLKSSSRANPIKIPRQVAMFLIKKYLDVSLVEIGKAFGDRDHTTVINSIDRIEDQQTKDSKLANDLNDLHKVIQNIIGV